MLKLRFDWYIIGYCQDIQDPLTVHVVVIVIDVLIIVCISEQFSIN